jgi:PAS domain S-box-containing protein
VVPKLFARTRGVLSSVRPRFRFAEWTIVLVSLGVAAVGAWALIALQREADEARRAELLVSRVGESASNLQDRAWQAADSGLDRRLRFRIERDRLRLTGALKSLAQLGPDHSRVARLDRRSHHFLVEIDETLRFAAAGRSEQGAREHRRGVIPSFAALQREVEAASDHYESSARTAARNAVVGSAAAIVFAALLIALFAILFGRKRVARERAALHERTALVRLLQSVSASSNAASTLDEALRSALAEICAHTGWPLGHAYLLSDDGSGELVSAGLWHVDGPRERFAPFLAATERWRFAPGEGLPGRVMKERRPVSVTAVSAAGSGMPRAPFARQVGLQSAFAFPVFLNGQVVSVLEFFSLDTRSPDQPLLEATAHVGFQLGYLLQRKRAEAELRATEARYRTLVEQLPLATYIDEPSGLGSSTYLSPQIGTMTGYSPDEWLADRGLFQKLVHPDDRDRVVGAIMHATRHGLPVEQEYRIVHRDGSVRWWRDAAVVVRDDQGNPTYRQGYAVDITARKRTEEALELSLERERAANEHLRELDRLKDEFIALVSHELRTPLTSIRGYLEFLLEDGEALDPEHARFLAVVERNAERLQHLVNDLLFVAQVDAGRLSIVQEEVDLPSVGAEAVEAARVVAGAKEIELGLEAQAYGTLLGDRARLAQLLDNLISNAIKFTPTGGRILVRTWSEEGRAYVSIADSGIGIPENEQPRLFERFYRAESATEQAIPGSGLGLAIAKAIVDAHGGTIGVESAVGAGTTFTVALPLAAEGGQRAA